MIGEGVLFYTIQPRLQVLPEFSLHVLCEVLRIGFPILHQVLRIYFTGIGVFIDQRVQMWLGKFGIIAFIVSVFAIANHINEHIAVKFLAIAGSDLHAFHHSFGVIAVHVHDRGLDHGRQRGAIIRTAGVIKIGSKSDLVIDHKMDRTSGMVALEIAHL